MTCVQTQRVALQLDTMAGFDPQKQSRTKAAASCFSLPTGATSVRGMPGFSFHSTEPSLGQNSGFSWNSGTGEGQQYSLQDPTHTHNVFDSFNPFQMDHIGAQVTSSGSQWNDSPAHIESEPMTRQESTGAHSQRSHQASSYDQTRSARLYSTASQIQYISSARSDVTGRSSPVDSGLYSPQQLEIQALENFPFLGSEDAPTGQSNFHRGSVHGLSHPSVSSTAGRSFRMFASTADDTFALSSGSQNLASHAPVSQESVIFNSTTIDSPHIWNEHPSFLESQRSTPTLIEDWALPPPHLMTTSTNSPLDHSPSLEGLSPKYVQDFPDLVDLPPYTTGDRVMRKPVGPRQSKVASDLATRPQRAETSDEAGFVGRSFLEIDNVARDHHLYQNVTPKADGFYHCPWEGQEGCQHKPEKLKCNYDKFVDSHLKPYKCKFLACENSRFSSTACLLRHEREAHAMHGHGDKPYLCTYEGCERGVAGNGFPRHWNLRDHMKRVHNDSSTAPKSNASNSPSPNPPRSKKRRADATYGSVAEKPVKRTSTTPVVVEPQEPSPTEIYRRSEQILQEIVKQLNDPTSASNMTLLHRASECIKVMAQMNQRINPAPGTNFGKQRTG